MWISRQGMSRDGRQEAARVGVVSLPGDPAAVLLDGERRQVPVFAPGGYQWQPMRGERVLVQSRTRRGTALRGGGARPACVEPGARRGGALQRRRGGQHPHPQRRRNLHERHGIGQWAARDGGGRLGWS